MTTPPGSTADAFREVMAGVPTPVSVVTTLVDERPHGTTVRAFTSLSMTPPMLLVSLGRRSERAQLVDGGDHVVVLGNVVRATADGGPPLTYHARTFGTHSVVPAA
ncbi:flavin reductase [Geodermatophilus sp. URMC 64]